MGHLNILPQEIPFAEFTRGHRLRAYKPDMSTDPWYPFQSHLNFEFAELALEAALNKEQVNHLLHLMKSVCSTGKVFTLSEYNDLQSTWQAASHCMTALQEFTVYCHLLWDWACSLLKHPSIGPHFIFDMQHLSKFNSSSFICFIDEPWMADKFWNIQSQLPPDRKVLPFILYADKVKLSSFGWQKGYPIVAHLANLPVSIQNGEGIGGGHVIGWLLIICVKETKEHSGKTQFANFKNAVWHESFRKLLQTIEKESQMGCWVNCWDGIPHHFFPVVLILSTDYEEQVVMALIHGVKSNFSCPICLIPHISDFPAQCKLQTSKNIVKVLEDACSQDTQEKKEQILIQQGLHDVDSAFMAVVNTDVYCTLSWDWLHANFSGKFGDHLWTELLRILDKARHQTMAMVEKNFSEMPHRHTLNHFDEALSISYTDGQKFEDLSKIVVFTCHDILLQNMEKEGYLLLHCLQAYIKFDLYTALELHMMHMIAAGWESLSTFNMLMQVKPYTYAFDNIEAKGITCNFNTKPNEKMHGPLKEKYQKHTNFKNIAQQILDIDHLEVVLELIHCRISNYDEDFFHVRLGCRVKQPLALGAIEQRSMIDKAFMYFETTGKPLPGGKHIQFQAENEITEYRYIKYTDHLHHYDCVLLKMCAVGNETFPLALDVHLNLWRVSEIFSVHSIICGALLYPDHTRLGEHFMMHKAAGHH
ncbi:hypothetical protein BKA83DRAFT_4464950 [Pisolithus microcarpus]|nr:hypothetical protein BKA83DRAFT_4464950 [Pisolithus microcarpus]